ncbi:MAG TPA: response regulator, partial [Candidatus Bathyarchaeia archaeon]
MVDDESEIREVLSRALRNWGYEVAEAENGSVALEKAFRELPDVILLDVSMPVVGGFEVLENLRKFPGTMSIPVILFTTLPAEKGELTGIRLGVEHYLTKPCDLHIL